MAPKNESLWHVEMAVLVAVLLQLSLGQKLTLGPKYVIAGFEILLVLGLRIAATSGNTKIDKTRRRGGVVLTAIISFANITSLGLVIHHLLSGSDSGQQLIVSALSIFLTNIIIFGLLYWQIDGGGAGGRGTHLPPVDFLFPQMSTPASVTEQPHWQPAFFDYLYVSMTNATAFSPTDTMPLTHRAKLLMGVQGLTSLVTVALVAARAINILG